MLAVVGDQQTKALADQLKSSYPEDYINVICGEGDCHLLVNVGGVFADLLLDAGLRQTAKECGFADLLKAHVKVKWRDLHL